MKMSDLLLQSKFLKTCKNVKYLNLTECYLSTSIQSVQTPYWLCNLKPRSNLWWCKLLQRVQNFLLTIQLQTLTLFINKLFQTFSQTSNLNGLWQTPNTSTTPLKSIPTRAQSALNSKPTSVCDQSAFYTKHIYSYTCSNPKSVFRTNHFYMCSKCPKLQTYSKHIHFLRAQSTLNHINKHSNVSFLPSCSTWDNVCD